MDKKTFRLLKYIASVPYRSQKEVETFPPCYNHPERS